MALSFCHSSRVKLAMATLLSFERARFATHRLWNSGPNDKSILVGSGKLLVEVQLPTLGIRLDRERDPSWTKNQSQTDEDQSSTTSRFRRTLVNKTQVPSTVTILTSI